MSKLLPPPSPSAARFPSLFGSLPVRASHPTTLRTSRKFRETGPLYLPKFSETTKICMEFLQTTESQARGYCPAPQAEGLERLLAPITVLTLRRLVEISLDPRHYHGPGRRRGWAAVGHGQAARKGISFPGRLASSPRGVHARGSARPGMRLGYWRVNGQGNVTPSGVGPG